MFKWPFVRRSTYDAAINRGRCIFERLNKEKAELTARLIEAEKNDQRDPATGRFVSNKDVPIMPIPEACMHGYVIKHQCPLCRNFQKDLSAVKND